MAKSSSRFVQKIERQDVLCARIAWIEVCNKPMFVLLFEMDGKGMKNPHIA